MAALVAGVQYGLSSHGNFHENKSLIFVKLTDSAQRAIEDFLRNRNKTSQNPTIQFLGNEGQLSFPSTQSSHGSAGFTFSLSGNQDIEGPQGGFECIQQTGPKSLESLGTLPCKMRIQANDDVYETTRHRMAVAEENNKNKCTRVIKPSGPDIGRKVKVKGTGRTVPPPANSRHRESTTIPTSNTQSRFSSYKPITSNPPVARAQPEKKVSDIMRRPLKERLVHLLALRPYKKPELYDRINREGIKERERSIMTMTLKQVAFMRDNTYHLHRHVWNDVQEDWPFYSEQEKAMLKRRKPQNLTPPGSSDGGSSGSGQSPNSTHPGSPPAITAPPPGLSSSKRPGYYQGNDGLPTKRPRISHYRKPEPNSTMTATTATTTTTTTTTSSSIGEIGRTTGGSSSNGGSVGGSGGGGVVGDSNSWDQRQQLCDRGDYRAEKTLNSEVLRGSYGAGKPCLTPSSDSEDNHHSSLSSSHNSHNSLTHNNVIGNHHNGSSNNNKLIGGESSAVINFPRSGGGATGYGSSPNDVLGDRRDREDRGRERDRERERSASGTTTYNDVSNHGRSGYAGNGTSNSSGLSSVCLSCGRSASTMPDSTKTSEYPDYLTYYTTISSTEQRRRYKEEFNADYEEYRRLHAQVEKVSKRFAQLEEQFKRETASGNVERLEAIKHQTYNEYLETKRDPVYRETKKRFDYLHEKLSHIKRLILEYDTQNGGGSNGGGSSTTTGGGGGGENCNSLHY